MITLTFQLAACAQVREFFGPAIALLKATGSSFQRFNERYPDMLEISEKLEVRIFPY